MLLRVVVIALFLCSLTGAQDLSGILQSLQQYCPYYGFDGTLYCPKINSDQTFQNTQDRSTQGSYIVSGLGYDRVTRELRFPVLPSSPPVADSTQVYETTRYTDIGTYLNSVYSAYTNYFGGFFVLSDTFVHQFASLFQDYRIDMAVTQKAFNSYATKVTSTTTPIPEFLQLLNSLPSTYNPNNQSLVNGYQTLIDLFGTDVSTASTHGGVFYQQTVMKSCYNVDIKSDMQHEIDTTLAKAPPGSLPYIRYRELGVFDVKGGNPEIPRSEYAQIIASFPQAPAITNFQSLQLSQVVPPHYQAAVQAAIDRYTAQNQISVNSMISTIQTQRNNAYKVPSTVYLYHKQYETFTNQITYHWPNCPFVRESGKYYTPNCIYLNATYTMSEGQEIQIFNGKWYQTYYIVTLLRDAATGYAPGWVQIKSTVTPHGSSTSNFESGFEFQGCIDMWFEVWGAFTACIDCMPVISTSPAKYGLLHSTMQCQCAGF